MTDPSEIFQDICKYLQKTSYNLEWLKEWLESNTDDNVRLNKNLKVEERSLQSILYYLPSMVRKIYISQEAESRFIGHEYKPNQRNFYEAIFMGNGNFSMTRVGDLHERINEGISLLGAMQQCPMSTDPEGSGKEHDEFCEKGKEELRDVVRDIAAALIGKETRIEFINEGD